MDIDTSEVEIVAKLLGWLIWCLQTWWN